MIKSKIKFYEGTLDQYNNIEKNDNYLYWITDKGVIYKGNTLFANNISKVVTNQTQETINGKVVTYTTISFYDSIGEKFDIQVASKDDVISLHNDLHTHENAVSNDKEIGHVKLSDDITDSNKNDGIAATPLSVKTALEESKKYTDTFLSTSDAMIFKGTIDNDKDGFATIHSLPTENYLTGWTYKVTKQGVYAENNCEIGDMLIAINDGPEKGDKIINEDWVVVQGNIGGAIVSNKPLLKNSVILSDGDNSINALNNGDEGQVLIISKGSPIWSDNNALLKWDTI